MRKVATFAVLAAVIALAVAGAAGARSSFTELKTVTLSGSVEQPAGAPSGAGRARIFYDMKEGLLCWSLSVKGINPAIAAHIHKAAAGAAGPIVVPLSAPTPGSKGCVGTSRALIRDIVANPAQYYVNVHTRDFPAGAVRGQLG
jgi:hypothetical protein